LAFRWNSVSINNIFLNSTNDDLNHNLDHHENHDLNKTYSGYETINNNTNCLCRQLSAIFSIVELSFSLGSLLLYWRIKPEFDNNNKKCKKFIIFLLVWISIIFQIFLLGTLACGYPGSFPPIFIVVSDIIATSYAIWQTIKLIKDN
jgi:hypothetical protein